MTTTNLKIWNAAKKTDTSATKDNTQGGRKSTSINGYWMIQRATEIWGPVGDKWWYEIQEERFDEGGPIMDTEGKALCHTVTHTIKLALFIDGCKPVIQYGHTPYIYKSKYGPITDPEAPKKSLMDALKKSLSMLGFSADVFMGEFEDQNYIEELKNEEALKKAEDKDAEKLRQKQEYTEWLDSTLKTLETSVSLSEIEGVFKLAFLKMKRRKDEEGIKKLTLAKDKAKKTIEAKGDK